MSTNPKNNLLPGKALFQIPYSFVRRNDQASVDNNITNDNNPVLPEILFITSYPTRECGIATYSFDLVNAIRQQFGHSFSLTVAALEAQDVIHDYGSEVKYVLHTNELEQYYKLAKQLNADDNLKMIFVQHEFGLYGGAYGEYLLRFLSMIKKPVITTFHTVLPGGSGNHSTFCKCYCNDQ